MGGDRISYGDVRDRVKEYLNQYEDYAEEAVNLLAMIYVIVRELKERRKDERDRKDADSRLHEANQDQRGSNQAE